MVRTEVRSKLFREALEAVESVWRLPDGEEFDTQREAIDYYIEKHGEGEGQ